MAAAVVVGDASRKPLRSADISPSFHHRKAGGPPQDCKAGVSAHKERTWAAAHEVAEDTEDLALSAKPQLVLASPCGPIHLSWPRATVS